MGKHIIPQRRGKGGLVYRSPSHRHVAPAQHLKPGKYEVKDIIHAPGRNSPLLVVAGENGKGFQIGFSGAFVGQSIEVGPSRAPSPGYTTALGKIPDGSIVHNIESKPGDGG